MASPSSSSTYGQKPLYYGTAKKSPLYYGSSQPAYYGGGGAAPYYYGGGSYGGQGNGQDADSLVGTITLGRVLRVIGQRWISVLVFLLIGLVAAFAVYRISPTIYEAKSEFTMDTRARKTGASVDTDIFGDAGVSYEEIFNTRLSQWRSDKIATKVVQQYRANYPASTTTDKEILDTLSGSELELVRHSRLITIAVRSTSPQLAASLANAYAESIEAFTDEENKAACDKAVQQITDQVLHQRRVDEDISKRLLKFRTENKIDEMLSQRTLIEQSLQKTTSDLLSLQSEVTAAAEWVSVLEKAQAHPENFATLPSSVPRSAEIGTAYEALQKANLEMNQMLATFTKLHPAVKAKEKELESAKTAFVEAVANALSTAKGNLNAFKNQLDVNKARTEELRKQQAAISQRIVSADAGLKQLEKEMEVSTAMLKDLMQRENEARIRAEQNFEIVRVGRPALVPSRPVLPNPMIIFSAGAVVALGLGLLFVLVLDHLEDTIVSLQDIEGRLALKVLAVLPHVRRKKREQVAKYIQENKYSQFAEAMAGLRNLLDSPRYKEISQTLLIMSTQPGEGKTITSCSLAISSAQAGKKTLLVDFDMRRPRLARVWGVKNIDLAHSFSHYLSRKDGARDFGSLINASGVEHLDVVASLPPDDVNPSSIMGSQIVPDFFKWARANYDRIIIDSPPFGVVGDVMTLASMVDSVMIMCCPDRTHFKPIQHAARQLGESGATVIGIVVNDVEMGSSNAFSQSGHAYGYGYRGYGGYGGYGGYRAYGGSYRPYAPYSPLKKGGKDAKGTKDAKDPKDAKKADEKKPLEKPVDDKKKPVDDKKMTPPPEGKKVEGKKPVPPSPGKKNEISELADDD
ncbi:MAG: polysaccharide biosynthesis tyrosine autokinase [Kiritimatiellae bacterium]|nr:polysaccharide biosynthesis tyrosine autokinase [Kiritimatiellia bacterium]